jgi:PAP2 superfamily
MHPLGIRLARHWRLEAWLVMSVLTIAVLLFAFGLIAQEVTEGKPLAFDQNVMRALRNSANPSVPIGPVWLQEAARDITSLGSTIVLGLITFAVVGYLFLARKSAVAWLMLGAVLGGVALNTLLKFAFARPRPDFVTHAVRVFTTSFPSGHATFGHYLSDNRSPSSANPPLTHNTPLFDVTRGVSDRAHRPEPNLPRRSLSDRCSRRLVHWRGLGHGLLGAVGVAAEWRSGRTIQPVVTAAKAAVRCSMYFGLLSARSRCHAIIESA